MRKTWETSEDIFKTGRKERREEKRGEDRKEILFSFGKYPPIIDSGLRFKKKKGNNEEKHIKMDSIISAS